MLKKRQFFNENACAPASICIKKYLWIWPKQISKIKYHVTSLMIYTCVLLLSRSPKLSWNKVMLKSQLFDKYVPNKFFTHYGLVTSYGDAKHTESTLAHVMACCLTTQSHCLNQYWIIIMEVSWHSSEGISRGNAHNIYMWYKFENH